jgi:hypothetical protein
MFFFAFASLFLVAISWLWAVQRTRWWRLPRRALFASNPRRARALARIYARGSSPERRVALALVEANGLLWEGELARALALLDARVDGRKTPTLASTIVRLQCLVFDERYDEVRALFAAHEGALRGSGSPEVAAVAAFLRFHEGDLAGARAALEALPVPAYHPIGRAAHLCLAAIAHREGHRGEARRHLTSVIHQGGGLFVVAWAQAEWQTVCPEATPPSSRLPSVGRLRWPRALVAFPRNLWMGINVLFFRTAGLRSRNFSGDDVAALVLFDVLVGAGARFVDYSSDAYFDKESLLAAVAPILFFLLTAHAAKRRGVGRDVALRLLAGFYAALPPVLLAAFFIRRTGGRFDLLVYAWLVAVVVRLVASVVPRVGVLRILGCALLFISTWVAPMHLAGRTTVFLAMSESYEELDAAERAHDALVFAEASKVHAAEALIAPERPGVADLYFVGAAGWAKQDVFVNEVRSAQKLLDDRFDTKGRSLVLANEPSPSPPLPLAASLTLRHAIEAVGKRMNREEDVLFLFLTSHGSANGLAIRPPLESAFRDETLAPASLRAMLDASGAKWRVIVIAGCESGVFIGPLRDEFTLVTTAASSERVSYGCAMGNPYTDFGQAIFGEQLRHERSFPTAFSNAVRLIGKREEAASLRPSQPQVFEGAAIGAKLRELEARLATYSEK